MTVWDHQDSLLHTGLYGLYKHHNLTREEGEWISDKNQRNKLWDWRLLKQISWSVRFMSKMKMKMT